MHPSSSPGSKYRERYMDYYYYYWMVPRLLHHDDDDDAHLLLVACQPSMSSLPTVVVVVVVFIQPMQTCIQHELLVFFSIHSCIQHHLYSNTGRDMDQIVSRLLLLLHDVLTVAHQPIVTGILSSIHRTDENLCVQSEEDYALLLYPLMYWSWFVSRYQEAYNKRRRRYHHTTLRMSSSSTHHYSTTTIFFLCPTSTWTQIKWSQIHLNVLISTKFPYIASTPTCKAQL